MEINLDNADVYFANHLYSSSWVCSSESDKLAALLMAKDAVFRLPYIGEKHSIAQAEPFPRLYCGSVITLPDDVVKAVFEEALELLKKVESESVSVIPEGVQSMSLGGASISFKDASGVYKISKNALEYLEPWLKKGFDFNSAKFGEVY